MDALYYCFAHYIYTAQTCATLLLERRSRRCARARLLAMEDSKFNGVPKFPSYMYIRIYSEREGPSGIRLKL